jgi:hypothetical protein
MIGGIFGVARSLSYKKKARHLFKRRYQPKLHYGEEAIENAFGNSLEEMASE